MSSSKHGGTCPYCDSETKHLNNHIRMSASKHGPQGSYPKDWDKSNRQRDTIVETTDDGLQATAPEGTDSVRSGVTDGQTPANPGGSDGQTVHGLTDDETDTQNEPTPVEFADAAADAREYECGGCGADMEYLAENCDDCGQSNLWQGVGA